MTVTGKAMDASKPLKEVVNGLRNELAELNSEVGNQSLQFEVGEVEIELQVAITAEGGGKLGFKCFYEVELGAAIERATTHTLKLKLVPRAKSTPSDSDNSGNDPLLINTDPTPRK